MEAKYYRTAWVVINAKISVVFGKIVCVSSTTLGVGGVISM
jgi:hypothetical protein